MTSKIKRAESKNSVMFKLILIGNSAAGKSSMLTRYTKDTFASEYQVTVGMN
jgi:GTPase SAR1 family protein